MDIEIIRQYCLNKKGTTESMPFGDSVLVFKVMNKVFALLSLESDQSTINLKCDPEYALELREQYAEIKPGYHMNKQHWNTVNHDGAVQPTMIRQLIDHSYDLIKASLPKKDKLELENL